jgi:adenylate cyclase
MSQPQHILEHIKALLTEAEAYRKQGLLNESLDTYRRASALLEDHEILSRNTDLIDAVGEKIRAVEAEIAELDLDEELPALPPEIQDLIRRLFSFSENQDIAALEGAVALAEFGQYEKSISEFQRLFKDRMDVKVDKEMLDLSVLFNSIIMHLRDSYKFIREQSIQLSRYATELSESYRNIKKEQKLRDSLSRYVGKNLVEKIVQSKDRLLFGTERKEVSVLFADIRFFTSMSERMGAEEVVDMLNEYFSAMVDIIFRNNGILDKFVGDELMAVFGHLSSETDHPCDDAVRTALEMQAATARLMKLRARQGKEIFQIGIGINTGNGVIGNVGSKNRMDYTVIGDCVNTAARLQQAAKGGEVIIGEETYQRLRGNFEVRKKGKIKLKNKAKPILCYLVLPQKSGS